MYLFNHRKKRKKIKDFLKNKIIESNLFFFESLKQDIPTPCMITDNTNYNFLKKNNQIGNIYVKTFLIKFSGIMKNYNREFLFNHARRYEETKLQINYRYISKYYNLQNCIFTSLKNNKVYIKTFINIFNNNLI